MKRFVMRRSHASRWENKCVGSADESQREEIAIVEFN